MWIFPGLRSSFFNFNSLGWEFHILVLHSLYLLCVGVLFFFSYSLVTTVCNFFWTMNCLQFEWASILSLIGPWNLFVYRLLPWRRMDAPKCGLWLLIIFSSMLLMEQYVSHVYSTIFVLNEADWVKMILFFFSFITFTGLFAISLMITRFLAISLHSTKGRCHFYIISRPVIKSSLL